MGRRDDEMEAAVQSVERVVADPVVRALTNRFYDITLTVLATEQPIVVSCPRSDSARTTIQALEDATGSMPSRITARRRKRQQRERESRPPATAEEAPDS